MKHALLVVFAMCAFAANSILNRAGVGGATDPVTFALVRVWSGAATLALIVVLRGGRLQLLAPRRAGGALALVVYLVGFSLAYLRLDAGLGALILFATVQLGLFARALSGPDPVGSRQIAGMVLALAGLAWLLWPGGTVAVDPASAALMIAAGLGWAAYTVLGKGATAPLQDTAGNFVLAALAMVPLVLLGPDWDVRGLGLAVLSGALASGLGYAVWYAVLPGLGTMQAGVAQLSVPVLAILGGAALLGEAITAQILMASGLVLGGIGLSVPGRSQRRIGSSGS